MSQDRSNAAFFNKNISFGIQEDRIKLNTCHETRVMSFLAEKRKTLATAGQTSPSLIHVTESQEHQFCRKEGACGCQEDLTKLHSCQHKSMNVVLAEKRAPAAARKTSPSLVQITKSQEHNSLYYTRKAPAAAGKTSPG